MAKKFLIFRADGNSDTGLGHMYRIFALIEMLKDSFDYKLLVREGSVLSVIPNDYKLEIIPTDINIQEEPIWIAKKFDKDNIVIIADGYQFNSEYQRNIKSEGFKMIYIDDLASEYMYADLVINHSPHIKESDFKAEPYTNFALGTKYAILRPLFLEAAREKRKIDDIDTAFVCFGGADQYDLTLKAVKALLEFPQFKRINIVLGGAYKHAEIFELKAENQNIIKIYRDLSELELLAVMQNCNFAIVPASTILYEVMCVNMLIVSGYYVDNQENIYGSLLEKEVFYGVGDFSKMPNTSYVNIIKEALLINSEPHILNQFDLFGRDVKSNFLSLLNTIDVSFRKANSSDLKRVYNWSNEDKVRKNSFNVEPIKFSEHKKWFKHRIDSERTLFLIVLVNSEPAGIVRYEIENNQSIVGVLVSDEFRGQKLASVFLTESAKLYFSMYTFPIKAFIKKSNIASIKAFKSAGYTYVEDIVIKGVDSYVFKLETNE